VSRQVIQQMTRATLASLCARQQLALFSAASHQGNPYRFWINTPSSSSKDKDTTRLQQEEEVREEEERLSSLLVLGQELVSAAELRLQHMRPSEQGNSTAYDS